MNGFVLAPAAKADLVGIWNYYATEAGDVDLADRMRMRFLTEYAWWRRIRAWVIFAGTSQPNRQSFGEFGVFSSFTGAKRSQFKSCGYCMVHEM
jgi:hypothetical protein